MKNEDFIEMMARNQEATYKYLQTMMDWFDPSAITAPPSSPILASQSHTIYSPSYVNPDQTARKTPAADGEIYYVPNGNTTDYYVWDDKAYKWQSLGSQNSSTGQVNHASNRVGTNPTGAGACSYIYPDGKSYATQPKDGDKFEVDGPVQVDTWFYSDKRGVWEFAYSTVKPLTSNVTGGLYFNGSPILFSTDDLSTPLNINLDFVAPPSKCECGAHAVGSNSHSSWCQMKELT